MDSSRRFDAPAPPSALSRAGRLIAIRWGVALAWMVIVAIVGAAALGLLFVDRLKTVAVESMVASTSLFVVVDAKATAVDVDALGPRIKAIPGVADATLRPRDAALEALVANGLPPPDGRNPLQDVWIVRPGADGLADGSHALATTVSQLRTALATLPQVAMVRVDERWVGRLGEGIARGGQVTKGLSFVGAAVLGVLLVCAAALGGTALRQNAGVQPSRSVLALAAALVSIGAVLVDAASATFVVVTMKPFGVGLIRSTCERLVTSGLAPASAIAFLMIVLSVAVAVSVADRSDSKKLTD